VKQLRSFIGFVSFHRKFSFNFAAKVAPLNALLRKDVPYVWSEACESAFQTTKEALCTTPVLMFPNMNRDFIVTTDASLHSLGYVLSQLDDSNVEHPIYYSGRALLEREKRWSTSEVECLALVEALKQFRVYLSHRPFKIFTDHISLVYLNRLKEANGKLFRWSLFTQSLNFTVHHKPGISNKNCDSLGRIEYPVVQDNESNNARSVLDDVILSVEATDDSILALNEDLNLVQGSPALARIDNVTHRESVDNSVVDVVESSSPLRSDSLCDNRNGSIIKTSCVVDVNPDSVAVVDLKLERKLNKISKLQEIETKLEEYEMFIADRLDKLASNLDALIAAEKADRAHRANSSVDSKSHQSNTPNEKSVRDKYHNERISAVPVCSVREPREIEICASCHHKRNRKVISRPPTLASVEEVEEEKEEVDASRDLMTRVEKSKHFLETGIVVAGLDASEEKEKAPGVSIVEMLAKQGVKKVDFKKLDEQGQSQQMADEPVKAPEVDPDWEKKCVEKREHWFKKYLNPTAKPPREKGSEVTIDPNDCEEPKRVSTTAKKKLETLEKYRLLDLAEDAESLALDAPVRGDIELVQRKKI
jgi:hypothetical protein